MNDPDPVKKSAKREDSYLGDNNPPLVGYAWSRFFLWISPAFLGVLFLFLGSAMLKLNSPFLFWFLIIITTIFCGILDARLRDISSGGKHPDRPAWVVGFCMAQIFVIPFIWIASFFGICAITSSNY